jgi:prevent-host-death family protein
MATLLMLTRDYWSNQHAAQVGSANREATTRGRVSTRGLDDMTSDDHNQVMSKVGIADLKAHLSEHLRRVRGGRTLTILDRATPVAKLVPYDTAAPLEVRRATRKPAQLRLPPPSPIPIDSLSALLQDRASR